MQPMPEDAYPVRDMIRATVKRPRELPIIASNARLRFSTGARLCCPMGLLPGAKVEAPSGPYDSGCR